MAVDEERQDDQSLSSRHALLTGLQDDELGVPRLPSSLRPSSRHTLHSGLSSTVMLLLLLVAAAWLGRMSADPSLFPYEPSTAQSDGPLGAVGPVHAWATESACSPLTCSQRRPAAFMSLFHNTLLPDLSLANQPYPTTTTRLPAGVLPELSVYYCMNAEWFQYILDDTLPALFKSYRRVSTWDADMPNLWSLQSFAADDHSVPHFINRTIGQRRIYITGEPRPVLDIHDMDAVLDTKTSPFSHPAGSNVVYFPNVYTAHYDFVMAGASTRKQPQHVDLSLIKPPHYSQLTNFKTRKFMAYMQANCQAYYRDEFFDLVSQYRRVDGIGSCRHNVPDSFDRKEAWWQAVQIYQHYKFALTLESQLLDGYITEKILGPMIAGAIPVYIGSSDIGDHFNERSFINVGRYASLEKAMERIMYLDQNETAYAEVLDEPWLRHNRPSMWMPHNNNQSYLHQQLAALRDVLLHPDYELRMDKGLPRWAKEELGWKGPNGMEYLRG